LLTYKRLNNGIIYNSSDREKSKEHWDMNLRFDNSRISDMFVGQLKSTLQCTICDYRSPTFELFWHLALPIPVKVKRIKILLSKFC
jgi:ubiquitin carboxyl-terminal hydrolase 2/21